MSVRVWWHLRDMSFVPMYTEGMMERTRDLYLVARWINKVAACNAGNNKMLDHMNEVTFPFENPEDTRTEEEKMADFEEAVRKLKFD